MDNVGIKGSLHTDDVAAALLQYRNTPLRGINKSPAELALGRELRDTIPLPTERYKVNPHWAYILRERERTMAANNDAIKIKHDANSRELYQLNVGDPVLCQNTKTRKWDRSGVVFEVGKHRQYTIRMDGSSRLSLRNRKHLQRVRQRIETPSIIPRLDSNDKDTNNNNYSEHVHPQPPPQQPSQPALRRSERHRRKPQTFSEQFGY